jgi:hypothetical protein
MLKYSCSGCDNVLWTLVGVKGDLSNPLSFVYALPALIFPICGAVFISVRQKKTKKKHPRWRLNK